MNVARASLEELLLDYEDYLRHRRLAQWAPDSAEATEVRAVPKKAGNLAALTDQERWGHYAHWLDSADSEVRANATICLIHQANFLLDRQIQALEQAFIHEGGYSEQLATERLRQRRKDRSDQADPTDLSPKNPPPCPRCGALMALRTAKSGKNSGSQFWGCTGYPECKGTAPV